MFINDPDGYNKKTQALQVINNHLEALKPYDDNKYKETIELVKTTAHEAAPLTLKEIYRAVMEAR
jgi:hypothetical protein